MIWPPESWEPLVWSVIGVVIGFWMVGAYNRLMRLRNQLGVAWAQIDALLMRREEALTQMIAALREPLVDESGALDALAAAQIHVHASADGVRQKPESADATRAFAATLGPWASAFSRVTALVEQRPQVHQAESVATPRAELTESQARWPFARQAFNDAVQAYNAAAAQWPTRLLARLFSFRAASPL